MTCPPHRRIITGRGDTMVGRCKFCGHERSYAWTPEEMTFVQWTYRKAKATPPASMEVTV